MDYLVIAVACVISSLVSNRYFYFKSVSGDMDTKWNEEKQCWDVVLHLDKDIDFSKKRRLIVKINHK